MNTRETSIEAIFSEIPAAELLVLADEARRNLSVDPEQTAFADDHLAVTAADREIQARLIQYFAVSNLSGQYALKAEESAAAAYCGESLEWQLLIDPLDGTGAFCRGEKYWGVMAGLCDREGRLKHSWNLTSEGKVYSSSAAIGNTSLRTFHERVSERPLRLDLYDYEADAAERYSKTVEVSLGVPVSLKSFPAAVWSGWELWRGSLDALLWLPASLGKQCYPDYDLIFLGALRAEGWKVAFGRQADETIQLVAVAPTVEDLWALVRCALLLNPAAQSLSIEVDDTLKITGSIVEAPTSLRENAR